MYVANIGDQQRDTTDAIVAAAPQIFSPRDVIGYLMLEGFTLIDVQHAMQRAGYTVNVSYVEEAGVQVPIISVSAQRAGEQGDETNVEMLTPLAWLVQRETAERLGLPLIEITIPRPPPWSN